MKTVEEIAREIAETAADAFIQEWTEPFHMMFTAADRHALMLGIIAVATPALRQREQEVAAECVRIAKAQAYYPDTKIGMRQQWVKDQIAAAIEARFPLTPSTGPRG